MSNEVVKVNQQVGTADSAVGLVPFTIARPPQEYLDDMRGVKVEYPQLKIPSGGAQFFEVDDEAVKELKTIIVYKRPMRVYYATSLDDAGDSNNPPDCFSNDFETGFERIPDADPDDKQYEARTCSDCPYSKWGSAGRGQACKEKVELYVLLEGNFLPMRFNLPVTSKVVFDQYVTRLMNKGQRYCNVITNISLSKQTTSGGKKIEYSRAEFKAVRNLTEGEIAQVAEFQASIKETLGI